MVPHRALVGLRTHTFVLWLELDSPVTLNVATANTHNLDKEALDIYCFLESRPLLKYIVPFIFPSVRV